MGKVAGLLISSYDDLLQVFSCKMDGNVPELSLLRCGNGTLDLSDGTTPSVATNRGKRPRMVQLMANSK